MKNKIIKYCAVILFIGWSGLLFAQKDFNDTKRDIIADNIETLFNQFATSLNFGIEVSEDVIQQIKNQLPESVSPEYVDSLFIARLDSVKQIEKQTVREKLLNNFYFSKKDLTDSITNFIFDSLLVSGKNLQINDFADKYVGLYNKIENKGNVMFKSGKYYIPDMSIKDASFEKHNKGKKVLVNFSLEHFTCYYDTTGKMYHDVKSKVQQVEYFSTTPSIKLAAYIYFKNFKDIDSYKILSIKPYDTYDKTVTWPDLRKFLRNRIIKNLKLYGNISDPGNITDSTLKSNLINLFDDSDKKSIECSLFFTDSICEQSTEGSKDSVNISVLQYCDNIIKHYRNVQPLKINPVNNTLQVKKEKNYYLVKWPANIKFIPVYSCDTTVPKGLAYKTLTNLYFKVDYSTTLFSKKNKKINYKSATITEIATYNKTIRIPQPSKKGSFSLSVSYSPMTYLFMVDKNSAFKGYKNEFTLSHGIGLNAGYYWFNKKPGRFFGVSTGFIYEMMRSEMTLDSSFYSRADVPPPIGDDNVEAYEERIWINNFQQSLKFNLYSIPVMFNFMTELNSKVLFNIGVGAKISFIDKNGLKLSQGSGTSTHKGWYTISFPDGTTGEYLLEDIDEYGYVTDKPAHIAQTTREINNTLMYLIINPTLSFPTSKLLKDSYIDFGLMFQYGLNPLYKNSSENEYLMAGPGNSNDVYSNGVKKNDVVIGLSIGFRYFNKENKQVDKIFNF